MTRLSEVAEGATELNVLEAASAMRALSDELQSALAHLTSAFTESLKLVTKFTKEEIVVSGGQEATLGIVKSLASRVRFVSRS